MDMIVHWRIDRNKKQQEIADCNPEKQTNRLAIRTSYHSNN